MNMLRLVSRSIIYHARNHLAAALGAAAAGAVIVGALGVGDSMRAHLATLDAQRLGRIDAFVFSDGRFFRRELAREVTVESARPAVGALILRGTVSRPDGSARAGAVQVVGVEDDFWTLAPEPGGGGNLRGDAVRINERLAERIGARPGETVILRVEKPSALPVDASIVPAEDAVAGFSAQVVGTVGDGAFGRFQLRDGSFAGATVFVPLARLQEKTGLTGRVNAILAGGGITAEELQVSLRKCRRVADAGLELRACADGSGELRTNRVFLDPRAAETALKTLPAAKQLLVYFANEFRSGDRATPYSMVAALPVDLAADEIALSDWLADDLSVSPGGTVDLSYFVIGPSRKLEEQHRRFRVKTVFPLEGGVSPFVVDRDMMPAYPGLTDAPTCHDWQPGFPVDLTRIRPKDEAYWGRHRGMPKAVVSLASGQAMWKNAYGDLTAVRFNGLSLADAERALGAALPEEAYGWSAQPGRTGAGTPAQPGTDFGGLFLGFSFFLLAAALLLVGLFFAFNVERRAVETGTLLALGFMPRSVRRLYLLEGAAVSAVGAAFGAALGVLYTMAALHSLSKLWSGVPGAEVVALGIEPLSIVWGCLGGLAVSTAAIWITLALQARRSVRELLTQGAESDATGGLGAPCRCYGHWVSAGFIVAACGVAISTGLKRDPAAAAAFFGAGALFLCGTISMAWYLLPRLALGRGATLGRFGLRNAARRRGRSLAVVGVLACGVFMLIAAEAFRREPARAENPRTSGTGGFAFLARASIPVAYDLDTATGRGAIGLDEADFAGVRVVPFRLREGDDASCRSLRRARRPPILGVPSGRLSGRFAFNEAPPGASDPWRLLEAGTVDSVPAIIDEAMRWTLGVGLGDEILYPRDEGAPVRLRVAAITDNSVLHGHVAISDERFLKLFPAEGGFRVFLIEGENAARAEKALARSLADSGFESVRTAEALNSWNAVENTYLSLFQALGGLGLMLGSAGLAALVLRHAFERRSELAAMHALGFDKGRLAFMVFAEHGLLVAMGLVCGVVSALLSVMPAMLSPGGNLPAAKLGAVVGAVGVFGIGWTYLAARMALRGDTFEALKRE